MYKKTQHLTLHIKLQHLSEKKSGSTDEWMSNIGFCDLKSNSHNTDFAVYRHFVYKKIDPYWVFGVTLYTSCDNSVKKSYVIKCILHHFLRIFNIT